MAGPGDPCEVEVTWARPGALVVRVTGEIDMVCAEDLDAVTEAVRERPEVVRVDLSEAGLIDHRGARHLEAMVRRFAEHGVDVELQGASPRLRELLARLRSPLADADWQDPEG